MLVNGFVFDWFSNKNVFIRHIVLDERDNIAVINGHALDILKLIADINGDRFRVIFRLLQFLNNILVFTAIIIEYIFVYAIIAEVFIFPFLIDLHFSA